MRVKDQNRIHAVMRLGDKEAELGEKLDRLEWTRHESAKNFRAYEKLEAQKEKVYIQFLEKFRALPEHLAAPVETRFGYYWGEL